MTNFESFDLSSVPEGATGVLGDMYKTAAIARSAWSVLLDLEDIARYLTLAKKIYDACVLEYGHMKWDEDSNQAELVGALTKCATLAYYRIIDSNPQNGRSAFPISGALNSRVLLDANARVKEQRHRSLAHHGVPLDSIPFWHDERVVVAIDRKTENAAIVFPHSRARNLADIGRDIAMLCDAIGPVAQHWWETSTRKLKTKLGRLARSGEIDTALIMPFDPENFFKTHVNNSLADYFETVPKAIAATGFSVAPARLDAQQRHR